MKFWRRRDIAQEILDLFAAHPRRRWSGHGIMRALGIHAGRLYPPLAHLEHEGLIVGEWEGDGPYPRRRLYTSA